ncbi:kinase-like protein [Aspergillus caelatus]|uniref:Kinase-like protein n=1 Tax=Aspergillus caelatus TaxID=61420 RepID=A0A5N7APK7_9EURO|nr:kinase-like protein [Aspergillus caelatus]KAE8370939.1 kinase-like protein [Aspergillus caelatus]
MIDNHRYDNYSSSAKRPSVPIRLTPSTIPESLNFDVKRSSFLNVRRQVEAQHFAGVNPDNRKVYSTTATNVTSPPVIFEELKLFVKWGIAVSVSEAQCLYVVRRFLRDHVPVPEVYGWRTDRDEIFIYMEYREGPTLEKVWDMMEAGNRVSICQELRAFSDKSRQLEQDPTDPFIKAEPFDTASKFHNCFTFLYRRRMSDPYSVPVEPFRHELPEDSTIKFIHGDLHRSNIIVTPGRPYHISVIVDWEQSGWLPAYWEARKEQLTAGRSEG